MNYSWVRTGPRKRVPYENPQGRRLHVLALRVTAGAPPALDWVTKPRSLTAEEVVRFLHAVPPMPKPLVVLLDNASIHRSHIVQAAQPGLWAKRIYLYVLPPYSPELNPMEPVFDHIKHHDLPERRYLTIPALEAAVDTAFTNAETRLIRQHQPQPGRAA